MAENKLQLRAHIIRRLKDIKKEILYNSLDFDQVLSEFKNTEDKKTLIKIILQEINCDNSEYDNFLSLILMKISPEEAENQIFKKIMSDDVSDNKKFHLINILNEINKGADYNALFESIKNPEKTIEEETKKYTQDIIFEINHQIDFLDFYFASDLEDKVELINNLIENSSPDEIAHVLSLIIYANDEESKDFIMEKLFLTHSYYAYPPLDHVLKTSRDKEQKKLVKKYINELKISGLRKEVSQSELYQEVLSNSKPLDAWITNIDGASNYVLMFAREHQNSCISFFSVVVNLKYGIIECFGFEDLERLEFEKISNRIFNEDKVYQIPFNVYKKLLKGAEKDSTETSYNIPYEYFAWRTLTYDIRDNDSSNSYTEEIFQKIKVDECAISKIKKADFYKTWYIKIGDNKEFEKLLNKINSLKSTKDINLHIIEYKDRIFKDKNIFDKQLLYQSLILYMAGQSELANILYSIGFDENYKDKIKNNILKKSILFYYKEQEENIFSKNINKEISEEIKKQWEKEF